MTGSTFDHISNEYSMVKVHTVFASCKKMGFDRVHVKLGCYDNQSICALKVFTA